jgi:hypothetical protein
LNIECNSLLGKLGGKKKKQRKEKRSRKKTIVNQNSLNFAWQIRHKISEMNIF